MTMIRWCSYCQSFIGEKPPYDNLEFTHIVCKSCKPKAINKEIDLEKVNRIKTFFNQVLDCAHQQRVAQAQTLILEGTQLGMDPLSLIEGIFNPIMNDLCMQVMEQKISAEVEQSFLETVHESIQFFNQQLDHKNKELNAPIISLLNLRQSHHDLGMKVFALKLKSKGYQVKLISSVKDFHCIRDHINEFRPLVLGMSLAQKKDISVLTFIAHTIKSEFKSLAPLLCLGGSGLKTIKKVDPVFDFVQNIANSQEFFDFLEKSKKNSNAA